MRKFNVLLLIYFFTFTTVALAAEVTNQNFKQNGDKAVATYDLVGVEGELEAEVTVAITINGVRHTAEGLKLTGDFGKNVKVGLGKTIIWDAMADLPSDFGDEGELSWDVAAVRVSATSLPEEQKPAKKVKKNKKAKKIAKKVVKKEVTPIAMDDITEGVTENTVNRGQQQEEPQAQEQQQAYQPFVNSSSKSTGKQSGTILRACGCYGNAPIGTARQNITCANGFSEIVQCQGECNGGGSPWGIACQ